MENNEYDEMLLVEADFEIIRNLANKVDLLNKNLDNLINNNNIFIKNMLNVKKPEDLNIENNNDKNKIEDNIEIKNKLYNMKLEELKNICKKNKIKKYTNLNKKKLVDYIINHKDINKLEL